MTEDPCLREGLERWPAVIAVTVSSDFTAEWEPHWKQGLMESPPDYIAFTSSAEVDGFADLMGSDLAQLLRGKSVLVSMDSSTTRALGRHGITAPVETGAPDIEGIVRALRKHCRLTESLAH